MPQGLFGPEDPEHHFVVVHLWRGGKGVAGASHVEVVSGPAQEHTDLNHLHHRSELRSVSVEDLN